MYVLGFKIVDIRRGYDEVFNIKFYYNMLGLYINVLIVECLGGVVDVECVCILYIYV